MRSIRRRLAVAGTIASLAALSGFAYASGTTPPAKAPYVASANGGHSAAISTRASGKKRKKHRTVRVAQAATKSAPLKTRASHGKHGRGGHEREGRDDAVRTGVDA